MRPGDRWGLLAWAWLVAATPTHAAEYTFVTLAGPAEADPGGTDGSGSVARLSLPMGVAADRAGNIYVADTGNHAIRKIRIGSGEVTTVAGLAGQGGSTDGIGHSARFRSPSGVAVDNGGCVYVADSGNHTIRMITPSGVVMTLAGVPGESGTNDGSAGAARFNWPRSVTVDGVSNVWVADSDNYTIRKIAPDGAVSTVAGAPGEPGNEDGTGSTARFGWPCGVATDTNGNIYVSDSDNHTIRQLTREGVVTTWAGQAGQPGTNDGPSGMARFNSPEGVAVDGAGNVYVADTFSHTLRRISVSTRDVTTIAGAATKSGSQDGGGAGARFNYPASVVPDSSGSLFVADWSNHTIRKVTSGGWVATVAGLAGTQGSEDGGGIAVRFCNPASVALDAANIMYVADSWNHTIRKVAPNGLVTTFAGLAGQPGTNDGSATVARFRYPSGIAVDQRGLVYVADCGNHTIRRITAEGQVTTLAGLAGCFGTNDGTGSGAEFHNPSGVAVDSAGNVFVADTANHTIRKISPAGQVTTLAGVPSVSGTNDGDAGVAQFFQPKCVAVDTAGQVYVADQSNQTIRKVSPAGIVTTLAGMARECGNRDGPAGAARFNYPAAVAVDPAANVYVADWGNHTIRQVSPAGEVTTLAGRAGAKGSADGSGSAAGFNLPSGVAVDRGGNVYVADLGNHVLRQGTLAAPDRPVIDCVSNLAGWPRQLDVSNLTTTSWRWTFIRRPAASSAVMSQPTARNPIFEPDVPDGFVCRFIGTNAAGRVTAMGMIELEAYLGLGIGQPAADKGATLTLHSAAGQPCELLASTDLSRWTIVTNLVNLTASDSLLAPAVGGGCCYYRLRQK